MFYGRRDTEETMICFSYRRLREPFEAVLLV